MCCPRPQCAKRNSRRGVQFTPLAAIHPFQAFPLRGRWRLRRMRCPPYLANSTSDKALLHLICLATLNIFPSRGRLGTTAVAGFSFSVSQCAKRNSRRGAPIHAGLPAIHAACGNSFVPPVPPFPSLALAPHHLTACGQHHCRRHIIDEVTSLRAAHNPRAPQAHLDMFAPKTREKLFFPLDCTPRRRYNIRDNPIVLGGRK